MPLARHQAACLSINAFSLHHALRDIFIHNPKPLSFARYYASQSATHVQGSDDTQVASTATGGRLLQALQELRQKNRLSQPAPKEKRESTRLSTARGSTETRKKKYATSSERHLSSPIHQSPSDGSVKNTFDRKLLLGKSSIHVKKPVRKLLLPKDEGSTAQTVPMRAKLLDGKTDQFSLFWNQPSQSMRSIIEPDNQPASPPARGAKSSYGVIRPLNGNTRPKNPESPMKRVLYYTNHNEYGRNETLDTTPTVPGAPSKISKLLDQTDGNAALGPPSEALFNGSKIQTQRVPISYRTISRDDSGQSHIKSPFAKFKKGQAVFGHLSFYGDIDASKIVATVSNSEENNSQLDYTGLAVQPRALPDAVTEDLPQYPWLTDDSPLKGTAGLEAEIEQFSQYAYPTTEEAASRLVVANIIKTTVSLVSKKIYASGGQYKSQIFGSTVTGTALATSDVDIRVYDKNNSETWWSPSRAAKLKAFKLLRAIGTNLPKQGFTWPKLVYARYPLITTVHKRSGVLVQVVACNTSKIPISLVKGYQKHAHFRPMYAFIKSMLHIRGLTDVFSGGLGSYPLVVMVATTLKLQDSANTGLTQNLLKYLDYWGNLDTYHLAVCASPLGTLRPKLKQVTDIPPLPYPNTNEQRYEHALAELTLANPTMQFLPCIQDPADKHNDLGHKTFEWKHIAATFRFLHKDLTGKLELSEQGDGLQTFLDTALGDYHATFSKDRQRGQEYGRGLVHDGKLKTNERILSLEDIPEDKTSVASQVPDDGFQDLETIDNPEELTDTSLLEIVPDPFQAPPTSTQSASTQSQVTGSIEQRRQFSSSPWTRNHQGQRRRARIARSLIRFSNEKGGLRFKDSDLSSKNGSNNNTATSKTQQSSALSDESPQSP
ncbi:hypothetical protein BT63DRAFT_90232 [Microthyrium microscopicum]|uniref:Poly(A) RNA polymerase mitochondrial-like central palm domain-containing protein n=1 Tax=Microthyrium microscopicum TaxID=703497 RepID=A0A6A6U031_9PEZI|nr:hypothetical protein BT63DRAFT_90232 [Microthyrium microscopicum]